MTRPAATAGCSGQTGMRSPPGQTPQPQKDHGHQSPTRTEPRTSATEGPNPTQTRSRTQTDARRNPSLSATRTEAEPQPQVESGSRSGGRGEIRRDVLLSVLCEADPSPEDLHHAPHSPRRHSSKVITEIQVKQQAVRNDLSFGLTMPTNHSTLGFGIGNYRPKHSTVRLSVTGWSQLGR